MKILTTIAVIAVAIGTLSGCVVAPDRGGDRDRDHFYYDHHDQRDWRGNEQHGDHGQGD